MILEIDAGNTRIKWRLVDAQGDARRKVAEGSVFAQEKAPWVFIELGQQLDKLPLSKVSRMKVANVRGDMFREAFSALMTEKWHLQPEYAVVARECRGVTNSYENPAALGVDRWLAMLAAFAQAEGACCVVDAGTAIKVDLLDGGGRHEGGYIVPGLATMRDSLAHRSKNLRLAEDARWDSVAPGRSTREAVEHGIQCCAVSLLERVRRTQAGEGVKWFLTGGDAGVLARHLAWEPVLAPDLVLDGLALAIA